MMQEWSDIIGAWVEGKKRVPVLIPPSMPLFEPDPALEQGATAAVRLATLPDDGPTGGYFDEDGVVPW